jgi:hypothetical protein
MRAVGWADGPPGRRGGRSLNRVYEARLALPCAACRRIIAVGERFTRRKLAAGRAVNVCRACAPFAEA